MLKNQGLIYVILDTEVTIPRHIDIFAKADQLARCGADFFQLRAENVEDATFLKIAQKLSKILRRRRKTFIINDRPDIAVLSDADGVHVGRDDLPVAQVRKLIGRGRLIGKTNHSAAEFARFSREDTDHLSIGPVFTTETKPLLKPLGPETIGRIIKKSTKSVFAIGGITKYNVKVLTQNSIHNVAICRGLLEEKDPRTAIAAIKRCLLKTS